MWKFALFGFGIILTTAVVVAQDHNNQAEKKLKSDIKFAVDTTVGQQVLKAGSYRVACDRENITFTLTADGGTWSNSSAPKGEVAKFRCKGKELAAPSARTEVLTVNKNGVQVLDKLLLKGSNVEHTFD